MRARLLDMGALVGESDHGASLSLYAKDPDGIEFEVMWQVPAEHWTPEDDAAVRPLDWDAAAQRWSQETPTP
jgi:catechol-2,3-dioxygenase